jgi:flavin reductase (DIM6/NTAB) family NADH-FMN oxidoreductase RutF
MWGKNVAFAVIRPSRYTKRFVDQEEYFSLSFLDAKKYRKIQNYLGTVSGRDEDKIAKSGLTPVWGDAPYFQDADVVLISRKLYAQSYTEESFIDRSNISECYPEKDFHTLYIGEVTKVLTK